MGKALKQIMTRNIFFISGFRKVKNAGIMPEGEKFG